MENKSKSEWTAPTLQRLSLKDAEGGVTNPEPLDLTDNYS